MNAAEEKTQSKQLIVWELANDVATVLTGALNTEGFQGNPSLRDLILRTVISIPAELAEGDQHNQPIGLSIKHFYRAKHAVFELRSQLKIARDLRLLEGVTYEAVDPEYSKLSRMIYNLIRGRLRNYRSRKYGSTLVEDKAGE
jgi:four helix bundle protein